MKMSYFDQVYRKLFNGGKDDRRAVLHEPITRSELYRERFESWKSSDGMINLLKEISLSYELKMSGIIREPAIHLLKSNYANGFAISYCNLISRDDFLFFFDLLAERVEQIGYRRYNSDVMMTDKGEFIETREKHYLKPQPGIEQPINQRYGNILIEYILTDEVPSYIKVLANIYCDSLYSKAKEFEKLAEYLLKDEKKPTNP